MPMASDKLLRQAGTPGIPAVRFGAPAKATPAVFSEARSVGAEVAYVTRDGAAQFDRRLPDCATAFFKVDLDVGLGSKLASFFKSGAR
ncbi:MAG: hypothetical protein FJZ01_03820 [Candidatus Sericytochromatia bacterium]|nr:hypothetical protein [Candidatus Tanganyikabacteria bacterium]